MVLNGICHCSRRHGPYTQSRKYQYDKDIGGDVRTEVFLMDIVLIFYNLSEYSNLMGLGDTGYRHEILSYVLRKYLDYNGNKRFIYIGWERYL